SHRGGNHPLRGDDPAADLRGGLSDNLPWPQAEARRAGAPIPARLPADTPLFDVPARLVKILDRDLVAAGIARRVKVDGKWVIDKRDDRGRSLDVHALRHTFGTLLSKSEIAPRTAQAAMRHSNIKLTMNVYTDPALLDVRGALDALPNLPLEPAREGERATGTEGDSRRGVCSFAPTVAPTPDNPGTTLSLAGNVAGAAVPSPVNV